MKNKKNKLVLSLLCLSVFNLISINAIELKEKSKLEQKKELTVYKSSTCDCCKKWIDYIKKEGYVVKEIDTNDMKLVKEKYGINKDISSCHTAIIDGYFVEGHVDSWAINKLITEKPNIKGISVPNMPIGSPGMGEGVNIEKNYKIIGVSKDNTTFEFKK